MATLKVFVANCLIAGHTGTTTGKSWIRDIIEFNCDGRIYRFRQRPEIAKFEIDQFIGRFCESTEVTVENIQDSEIAATLAAVDRICWLLSFASLSRVVRYGHSYPLDEKNCTTHKHAVMGISAFFRPTLEIRDGALMKNFVETAYPKFKALESARKLNIVIDYLLQAERTGQPTECKLLFSFVLLENLKDSYARSKKILYAKGYFRKTANPKGAKYSFEELLTIMLKEVRMRKGLKRVISLRNEIIHSGLSRKTHKQQWATYERVHDLIREYVLRLIGYKGKYLIYSTACSSSAKIV